MWFGIFVAICLAFILYARSIMDRTLMSERLKPAGPTADPVALAAIRLAAVSQLVFAVLDTSVLHVSDGMPVLVHVAGFVLFGGGLLLLARSMAANKFFSTSVRIQEDRGHRVVSQGPYGVVRHPGYVGMIVAVPGSALGLGSWWALAIALVYSALIARRVMVEDRFLQQNLPGYSEYASRVRYRLIPGVV